MHKYIDNVLNFILDLFLRIFAKIMLEKFLQMLWKIFSNSIRLWNKFMERIVKYVLHEVIVVFVKAWIMEFITFTSVSYQSWDHFVLILRIALL